MKLNLYLVNNPFQYEVGALVRLFFPDDVIMPTVVFDVREEPYIYAEISDEIKLEIKIDKFNYYKKIPLGADSRENKLLTAQMLYKMLCAYSGVTQPWGLLTGVRPAKLFRRLCDTDGARAAEKRFRDVYYVSSSKIGLLKETEKHEREILRLSRPESFSLYVGIPFCPSRCSYCSFVIASVERTKKLVEPYVNILCEEIRQTAQIANELGLRLETVYFGGNRGGGAAEQLNRLLSAVRQNFDMTTCREFTVEAGRPDTVTDEKLCVLKENGVERISINPQTLNNDVLKTIGRGHTAEQFFEAYELARKTGFKSINTDLIAGLPDETLKSFKSTVNGIKALDPQCVTIHTLCLKRASSLTAEGKKIGIGRAKTAASMLAYAQNTLNESGYIPYYLYRQSKMVGNLENVGWSKPGFEGLYNVYEMDETHTVLACGAAAVTKLTKPDKNIIERIANYKYPFEYVGGFDELIKRKQRIIRFYRG